VVDVAQFDPDHMGERLRRVIVTVRGTSWLACYNGAVNAVSTPRCGGSQQKEKTQWNVCA